jgi:hypothetical protein
VFVEGIKAQGKAVPVLKSYHTMKLISCLIKQHTMKMYSGVEEYLHTFLNSAQDGGE